MKIFTTEVTEKITLLTNKYFFLQYFIIAVIMIIKFVVEIDFSCFSLLGQNVIQT